MIIMTHHPSALVSILLNSLLYLDVYLDVHGALRVCVCSPMFLSLLALA